MPASISPFSKLLVLSDKTSLAQGVTRRVYQHPDYDDLLVKVIRPEIIEQKWGQIVYKGKLRRRDGKYVTYMRELREYLAVRANLDRHPPVLERVYGLAETDLGVGLVVEKLRGPDGGLAEVLKERVRKRGLSPDLLDQFAAFRRTVEEFNIVFGNLGVGNIVLVPDGAGGERMVAIDGIGDKALIPFASWSRRLNRLNNARLFRRIERTMVRLDVRRAANMGRGNN